jgi:hypothetical protein
MRIAAVKWLLWKLGKEPREMTFDDFNGNGFSGLLRHYNNSPYLAFVESGHAYSEREFLEQAETGVFHTEKLYPWEMPRAPFGYENKGIRIAAVKWLRWKLGKRPEEITSKDFNRNGLAGLVRNHFNGSPFEALFEAGLLTKDDEAYMRLRGSRLSQEKKWAASKL